jgi:hypothetical protein
MDNPKIDIQEKRKRTGRWYYIASTTKYPDCEVAIKEFNNWCVKPSVDRYRAVITGSEISKAGRDPQGSEA